MVSPLINVSTKQCCLAVSYRTSSVISILTEVPKVDVCPVRWYGSNDLNHVWTWMGSNPIQSHEWFLFPFLFFRPNRWSRLGYEYIEVIIHISKLFKDEVQKRIKINARVKSVLMTQSKYEQRLQQSYLQPRTNQRS